MNRTRTNLKDETSHWKWLAYIAGSALIVMVLGIQDPAENRVSFAVFAILLLGGAIAKGFARIGLTKKNLTRSIVVGAGVGIVYGIFRGLMLKFVPYSEFVLGADLALLAPRLEAGISIGPLLLTKNWLLLFWVTLLPGMFALELYFRGLLFLILKERVHWTGALAIASIVQAISRRTPHSLIMGSIAGVLMQRYDNLLAPTAMHAIQWLVATAIFLYL